MRSRPVRTVLAVLAVTLAATVVPVRPAGAFVDMIGRAVVQTFVNLDKKVAAYERIEAKRDADLAAVDAAAAALAVKQQKGWITGEQYASETARLDALRAAIVQRAEREKAMNRAAYNRAVGEEWRTAAEGAVIAAVTGGGRAGALLGQLRQGQDPLSAALQQLAGDKLAALLQGSAASRSAAADELNRAIGALDVLRDPRGELRNTAQQLESILRTGEGELPATLSAEATRTAQALVSRWQALLGQWRHLTANQVRVSTDRLLGDQRWVALTNEILRLGSVPLADRAVLATRVGIVADRIDVAVGDQEISESVRNALAVRVLAEVLRVEQDRAAGLPVVFDLDAYVREQLSDLTAPTTAVPAETTAGGDTTTPTDTGPPEGVDQPTGGSVHAVDESSGLTVGNGGTVCLDVKQLPATPGSPSVYLEGCTTTPRFETVFDLAEGTVSGWFEADLACPGEGCSAFSTASGSIRGEFGPLPYGQPTQEVPDGFPFPDHHWYPSGDTYWAGAPIELAITLTGESDWGDGTKIPGSFTTTVTGWVSSDLQWSSREYGNPLPQAWYGDLSVMIDHPQDQNPRWHFYFGFTAGLPESNLALPPWEE